MHFLSFTIEVTVRMIIINTTTILIIIEIIMIIIMIIIIIVVIIVIFIIITEGLRARTAQTHFVLFCLPYTLRKIGVILLL